MAGPPTDLQPALRAIERDGYVVLEDVADPSLVDALDRHLRELLHGAPTGRNPFEGHRTQRINNLLAKGELFQQVVLHEPVLALAEAVLGAHLQLSIITAINILPGETPQGWHTDDALFPLPVPHPPVVFNTMWALDDFTASNGATRLVPGSHRWETRVPPLADAEGVAAEMSRGSILAWVGNLWHQGGPNTTTDTSRLGIACNYNQGWLRQQENQYLGIPREVVRAFPERLQRLVGYDLHPPFLGNVDGRNPLRLVRDDDLA